MLSFLTAMLRRRELSTSHARNKIAKVVDVLSHATIVRLRDDPANEAALTLAEMALGRLQDNMKDARDWTNERIAGEFLLTVRTKTVDCSTGNSEGLAPLMILSTWTAQLRNTTFKSGP
jgi:hypothetical protein